MNFYDINIPYIFIEATWKHAIKMKKGLKCPLTMWNGVLHLPIGAKMSFLHCLSIGPKMSFSSTYWGYFFFYLDKLHEKTFLYTISKFYIFYFFFFSRCLHENIWYIYIIKVHDIFIYYTNYIYIIKVPDIFMPYKLYLYHINYIYTINIHDIF